MICKQLKLPTLVLCFLGFYSLIGGWTAPGLAAEKKQDKKIYPEQEWGIGAYVRSASIPYDLGEGRVNSFIPVLFYEGERFFLDGMEGGAILFRQNRHRVELMGRLRFFDIPKDYQNEVQGDTVDFGLRYRFQALDDTYADLELMTDDHGRWHANVWFWHDFVWKNLGWGDLELSSFAKLRYKDKRFNDHYFGLTVADVGDGFDLSLGARASYHVWENLYLIGRIQATWFEKEVRELPFVSQERVDEVYFGIALMNDKKKEKKPSLTYDAYLRIAHGWATYSNLTDILIGEFDLDSERNQLSSLFYGHPLTDELFGLPLDIYLTPGFVWHWSSSTQSSSQEYVVAIKAYYTFNWPVRVRIGLAEGLSYVSDIPHVEEQNMIEKEDEPSNLMNYIDASIDVNVGDLFRSKAHENLYFGYSIHHRSAIFETASQFGRTSEGSNYHTFYLQYHF